MCRCLQSFRATKAALSLATPACNLVVLFQRHFGWQQKVDVRLVHFRFFVTLGIIAHPPGKTTINFAVPLNERDR